MNKLIQAMLLGIVGLVLIRAAGPTITQIIQAITPLVCVIGVIIALLRFAWWYTR